MEKNPIKPLRKVGKDILNFLPSLMQHLDTFELSQLKTKIHWLHMLIVFLKKHGVHKTDSAVITTSPDGYLAKSKAFATMLKSTIIIVLFITVIIVLFIYYGTRFSSLRILSTSKHYCTLCET